MSQDSKSELEKLKEENAALKAQLQANQKVQSPKKVPIDEKEFEAKQALASKALTIVVFGASGHLARTKTFPALCELFHNELLPEHVSIVGYARSPMTDEKFHASISEKLKGPAELKQKFLARCSYVHGDYDAEDDFKKLNQHMEDLEKQRKGPNASRAFYFAIPPQVFPAVARHIKNVAMTATGWNRVIVEKPFGKDTESSEVLSKQIKSCFTEGQLFRIDHYLGKEMVQNMLTLRFGNAAFEPLWNRNYVSAVLITFKEPQGIEGRGSYFDEYGIIRDVMQNHLMQMLCLAAMEAPVTLSAEDIRDEKVKVLRCIRPVTMDDVVIGQYIANPEKKFPGYTEDPSVPAGSLAPTFAQFVVHIHNPRWEGVPFILKCGKAVDDKKAEIRIQFRHPPASFFGDAHTLPANELVMRVNPDEAIYLKLNTKRPGLSEAMEQTELNLTYHSRFQVGPLPDAYERLILDVLRGDHRLFVRDDELRYAWEIFTPVLHHIDQNKIKPLPYVAGSRGPKAADEMAAKVGYKRYSGYHWVEPQ